MSIQLVRIKIEKAINRSVVFSSVTLDGIFVWLNSTKRPKALRMRVIEDEHQRATISAKQLRQNRKDRKMPLLKGGTISRAIQVGKFVGPSFLSVLTARGDLKMFHGDHLVEVPYTRAVRQGEPGFNSEVSAGSLPTITKVLRFVVPEDAAKVLGIFLPETVEEENERVAREAVVAAEVAAGKKAAAEAEAAAKLAATK